MKLQQLRYLREVVRRGLNVSEAAEALYTSQPGISKQIRLLEDELGVQILVRHGKRVVDLTEPGRIIVEIADRMLQDADSLQAVGREFGKEDTGALIDRDDADAGALCPAAGRAALRGQRIRACACRCAKAAPSRSSSSSRRAASTSASSPSRTPDTERLVLLPCYQWNRGVITPPGPPAARREAAHARSASPATRSSPTTSRSRRTRRSRRRSRRAASRPNVVLTAVDADVIKALRGDRRGRRHPREDGVRSRRATRALRLIDASHLFEPSTTRIAVRRNAYLRRYVYDFIELFAPHLSRTVVEKTMRGPGTDYELTEYALTESHR